MHHPFAGQASLFIRLAVIVAAGSVLVSRSDARVHFEDLVGLTATGHLESSWNLDTPGSKEIKGDECPVRVKSEVTFSHAEKYPNIWQDFVGVGGVFAEVERITKDNTLTIIGDVYGGDVATIYLNTDFIPASDFAHRPMICTVRINSAEPAEPDPTPPPGDGAPSPGDGGGCSSCRPGKGTHADAGIGMDWSVALGTAINGMNAGLLSLVSPDSGPHLLSPSSLTFVGASEGATVVRHQAGYIQQVSTPFVQADVQIIERGYAIDFRSVVDGNPAAAWFVRWTVQGADATGKDVTITETRKELTAEPTRPVRYLWPSSHELRKTLGTGDAAETIVYHEAKVAPDSRRVTRAILKDQAGTFTSKTIQTYTNFPFGERLLEVISDPGGGATMLTNRWTYCAENPGMADYGRVSSVVKHNGSVETKLYNTFGKPAEVRTEYPGSAPDAGRELLTTQEFKQEGDDLNTRGKRTTTVTEYLEDNVEIRTTPLSCRETIVESVDSGAGTLTTETIYLTPGVPGLTTVTYRSTETGRILWQSQSDGTATTYSYTTDGDNRIVTKDWGAAHVENGVPVVDTGTRTITTINERNITTSCEVRDYQTEILISGWTVMEADEFGRPLEISYSDGTSEFMTHGCCGLTSKTGRDGITTTFGYDDLDRLTIETRQGLSTVRTYDAAGRVVKTTQFNSDNKQNRVLSENTYDEAGRLTSTKDVLGNVTTYDESIDAEGLVVRTTTHPDGSTDIRRSCPSGSPLSIGGTAARPVRYEYGAEGYSHWTKEIRIGEGDSVTEWSRTWTDFAGRQSGVDFSDGTFTTNHFDPSGRLVKTEDRSGLVTLYEQDALGRTQTRALDVNPADTENNTIDYQNDRVTRTVQAYETLGNLPWEMTTHYQWETGDDDHDNGTIVGVTKRRLDGHETESVSFGLTTRTTSMLVPTANGPVRTTTTTAPDQTYTVTVETNGLLSRVTRYTTAGQLIAVTNGYDTWNRRIYVADGQNRRVGTTYNIADQRIAATVSEGEIVRQTTSYTYDKRGRVVSITHPDGGVVNNQYYPSGDLMMTWGARTYPVGYTYDPQGRMRTMVTWRNFEQDSGRAVTEWIYSPLNGTLQAKKYADGSTVQYTYGPGGRLATRQWARGVTTTYEYYGDAAGDLKTGDLKKIDYADGTPDVTYTYDRLGRVETVADGTGTRTDTYSNYGVLESEDWALSAGPISSARIARGYDALHRLSTMTPTVNGEAQSLVMYGYDAAGRINNIAEGDRTYTYGYHDVGDLITSFLIAKDGQPKLAIARNYDLLNRLTSIVNTPPGGTAQSWTYTYNDANQRTRATLADGSYWSYAYDDLGQVIGGSKRTVANEPIPGMQFGYWFDDIGNRRTETNNAQVSAYTANALNQYEQRTVPGVVDVIGEATENAKVVVNVTPAAQLGAHFHAQVEVDNTDAAQYPEITVIVGQAGSPDVYLAETKGKRFVAKTPEVFDYDEDGNLKQDGRWTYTWDAENRLIKMETIQAAIDANVPYRRLEFSYDANSRRIGKKVYSTIGGNPIVETAYLYDGWNLVAELIHNPQSEIRNSYTWGLDLSQTLQGAGGVGGLLSSSLQSPASSLLYCYDGNGNVMALVDAADKSIMATYEYDPFGNTLRATGAKAAANPFRFSTKYTDDETGLVYYGYRYYLPGLGRWASRDRIEEEGGIAIYCFLRNAINGTDCDGLFPFPIDIELKPGFLRGVTYDPASRKDVDTGWIQNSELDRVLGAFWGMVTTAATDIPLIGGAFGFGLARFCVEKRVTASTMDKYGWYGKIHYGWLYPLRKDDVTFSDMRLGEEIGRVLVQFKVQEKVSVFGITVVSDITDMYLNMGLVVEDAEDAMPWPRE